MERAGASAPREEVHQRLLELLAEQSRRVPVAVGCLMVVVALMAAQRMPVWIPAAWLLGAITVLLMRRHWLALLPTQIDRPSDQRMGTAVRLSFLNGCVHGMCLGAFPFLPEVERSFFTLLILALCTGAVGTTAGHRKIFLAYVIPAAGTLPLWWLLNPGGDTASLTTLSLAVLIVMYLWVLITVANNAWRNFNESVRIRFQDLSLIHI